MIAALRHNTVVDYSAMFFSNVFHAVPSFLVATLLIYFVALKAGWFPTSGWTTLGAQDPAVDRARLRRRWRCSRGSCAARCSRRSSRTTSAPRSAKGLRYRRVVGLHVLRNSLIPVVTAAGPLLGFIITGSFVIELIFNIPGIGQQFVDSVSNRDYSVVMGLTVLLSVIVILANLVVDILYGILDPRTRDVRT